MRPFDDEMDVRLRQRRYYFEDPNYRKWSSIRPITSVIGYETLPDDDFFVQYLFGSCENISYSPNDIRNQMDNGKELPINWYSIYAYFDERFNDPENNFKHQLINQIYYTSGCNDDISLIEILEEYRAILLNDNYDII